jgi:RHS repeat-associated protein
VVWRYYYYAGTARIALRVKDATGMQQVYYLFADHLGSTNVTTDEAGNQVSLMLYTAWGEPRLPPGGFSLTDYGYTGQRKDEGIGLYFYNARWYDSALGRFTSPDSIIPEASQGVQAWDRYAYVNNSPLNYADPSGHCLVLCTAVIGGAVGAVVGAVGYTAYVVAAGKEFNTGNMLLATAGGAAAGALIGTGVGFAAGMSTAAVTTAAVTTAGAAESANVVCGGDMCTGEAQGASRAAQAVIPAAENAASQVLTSINTGSNVVYKYMANGLTKYYGIINDFARRASEHFNARNWTIEPIEGLENLSRYDARAVEQVLIQNVGLPNLYNKINSIAQSSPIYEKAIQRGEEILRIVGMVER